jgi:tetratricopeptide (TPR) repeat protein
VGARVLPFPSRILSSDEYRRARAALEVPFSERLTKATSLALDDPDVLLSIAKCVKDLLDSSPPDCKAEAEFFYRFVESPRREIGLFDERVYFLGEFALLAGTSCRYLSLGNEARLWFDRSESAFRQSVSATADLSRLAYQRLALRMAERELDAVLELSPSLIDSFLRLGMREDELKVRFLQGLALMESERVAEAIELFEEVRRVAVEINAEKLIGLADVNLTQLYGLHGNAVRAIEASRRAVPMLERLGDRVGLAKVQWGLGILLREQGDVEASIHAYSSAQDQFRGLEMRADIAAIDLVIADMRLEQGRETEAIALVARALPILDEFEMVPEGMAALALLRESVRQHRLNRSALRELHGYFDDIRR